VAPTFSVGIIGYKTSDFAKIASMGIKLVRWDRPDAATIELGRTFGVEVLPLAAYGYTDLSGTNDEKYPPLPQNRGEWAKRMVDRWRTMKTPPKVLEVWNEPWQTNFWKPAPDPVAYLELVKAFAREAWAVWPNVTILVSADEGCPDYPAFRKDLIAADKTNFLSDPRILPTTHNYVEARSPTEVTGIPCKWDLNRYECAYRDFKAHGHPNPMVWVTEFGWESNTTSPGFSYFGAVTEQQQATYAVQALEIFKKSGMVAAAFGYMITTNDPWNYNWLTPDNKEKPVVAAVRSYLGK